ncbi:MAG: EAL domain-containing protein [Woeseiaceae bacterium]|nr:EAL domain-containing protein [Woeseiaceae bacterium]
MAPEPTSQAQLGHAVIITRDKGVWRAARNAAENEGYEATHYANIDELRSAAKTKPPALILFDADGPGEDKLGMCREIAKMPGCEFIPLLVCTFGDALVSERSAYDACVTAMLKKPLSTTELSGRMRSLGDTGKTISGIRAIRPAGSDVLEHMPDAFFIVGTDGKFREYLGGANDDFVLQPGTLEGRNVQDVWPAHAARELKQAIRRVIRNRDSHVLKLELENDNGCRAYELRLLVQGRDRVMLIARDLSSGMAVEQSAPPRGTEDTLTGLTAREVFMRQFEEAIADASLRERGVAVLCMDIDRFTRINDTLGRAVGDAVLQVTAKRVSRCLRDYDQLARIEDNDMASLTRISGDEFVLLLGDIESREDVATVASRIRDAFAEPVTIEGHQLDVTPSIGIAQYPLDGDSADDLLKNARVALDEAKMTSSVGQEFFSSTMKFRALRRFDVKNELYWAIEKDQLDIHYLPRIDLQTGEVAGLEALLRWIHPLRGSVPLSEVIPLAEATGLIFAIGEWVIRSACQQAKTWLDENESIPPVSVNLSQQEFARDDLHVLIETALKDTGLPAHMLELELTEGLLLRSRQADATIERLNKIGVGIVIDDFGQGLSSVAHLTRMPLKAIKIDRAFVDGVREPGEKQAICAAMIAMSRELGISVIAEGVESQLQVEFLKERGCDAVQGFLFTEPLPPEDVLPFLESCRKVTEQSTVIDLDTVRRQVEIHRKSEPA